MHDTCNCHTHARSSPKPLKPDLPLTSCYRRPDMPAPGDYHGQLADAPGGGVPGPGARARRGRGGEAAVTQQQWPGTQQAPPSDRVREADLEHGCGHHSGAYLQQPQQHARPTPAPHCRPAPQAGIGRPLQQRHAAPPPRPGRAGSSICAPPG